MIKYCRQCGRELHYKEEFYFTDQVCCQCRGLAPFDDDGALPSGRERTPVERALFERYPVWQLMIEKAERQWREAHPQPQADVITLSDAQKYPTKELTKCWRNMTTSDQFRLKNAS